MKKIINEKTELPVDGISNEKHDFKSLCRICLLQSFEGVTKDDMYKNFKVIDKIEECGEDIILEDADHKHLLLKINQFRWPLNHRDILKFTAAVEKAEEYKIPTP